MKRSLLRRGGGVSCAFTLVELLVVIAIIGVLIALLLPAVQAAREAARRSQCINQLKQLALACHNYHDKYESLPSGRPGSSSNNTTTAADGEEGGRWSFYIAILPYMEQSALYESLFDALGPIKKAGVTVNTNGRHPWNGSETGTGMDDIVWHAVRNKIGGFMCPSDIQARVRTLDEHGVSCYGANGGDYTPNSEDYQYGRARGPFAPCRWYGFEAVSDGTSNTLLFAERASSRFDLRVIGVVANIATSSLPTASGGCETSSFIIQTCLDTAEGSHYKSTTSVSTGYGSRWADGANYFTWINTVTRPNTPTCRTSGDPNPMITPASSYHSGGANGALCDASVRFFPDTIDAGTVTSTGPQCVSSGASPFGVWGALGSKDGGEQPSRP